jgi:integrase
MLKENNAREGFIELDTFDAVHALLEEDLQPLAVAAYVTGWRVRAELQTRTWNHVDLDAGWIRLEPGETKNGEGRMFPLTPELRTALELQRERTDAIEKETGSIIPWVFHHGDQPIRYWRRSWLTAIAAAGVPGLLRHDFRRTAVRNLERAGVPRTAAMKMVGHKTESIYRRYAIVDEGMIREAADKLTALHTSDRRAATARAEKARQAGRVIQLKTTGANRRAVRTRTESRSATKGA